MSSAKTLQLFLLCLCLPWLASCATVVATAGGGMASNLNTAIMNQDDEAVATYTLHTMNAY